MKATNSVYGKIHYDGKTLSDKIITRDEVLSLDRESVDHFFSVDLGIWEYRTADGRWIKRKLSGNPLGSTCLKIMECTQCEPGVFFGPDEIAELTNIYSLKNPNNLSARLRSLRLYHQETHKKPNFFLSKRAGGFGVAWATEKSFIQIIRVKSN